MTPIYRDREPEDLRPLLDAAGIERIVVVQAAWTLAETLFTIGLSTRFPWIAGVVGWVDPLSPALEEEIAALTLTGRLKGIRPVSADDNRSIAWMLDARLERCWSLMRDARTGARIPRAEPGRSAARHAVRAASIPDMRSCSTIAPSRTSPAAASSPGRATSPSWRSLPNVACKFSGLLNCAPRRAPARPSCRPYADHVLGAFGARPGALGERLAAARARRRLRSAGGRSASNCSPASRRTNARRFSAAMRNASTASSPDATWSESMDKKPRHRLSRRRPDGPRRRQEHPRARRLSAHHSRPPQPRAGRRPRRAAARPRRRIPPRSPRRATSSSSACRRRSRSRRPSHGPRGLIAGVATGHDLHRRDHRRSRRDAKDRRRARGDRLRPHRRRARAHAEGGGGRQARHLCRRRSGDHREGPADPRDLCRHDRRLRRRSAPARPASWSTIRSPSA